VSAKMCMRGMSISNLESRGISIEGIRGVIIRDRGYDPVAETSQTQVTFPTVIRLRVNYVFQ
jgi:hypothetical protein